MYVLQYCITLIFKESSQKNYALNFLATRIVAYFRIIFYKREIFYFLQFSQSIYRRNRGEK